MDNIETGAPTTFRDAISGPKRRKQWQSLEQYHQGGLRWGLNSQNAVENSVYEKSFTLILQSSYLKLMSEQGGLAVQVATIFWHLACSPLQGYFVLQ